MPAPFAAPLPARVPVLPNEEIYSFLRRSAQRMGYPNLNYLLQPELSAGGVQSVNLLRMGWAQDYAFLAHLLGVEEQVVRDLTFHRFATAVQPPQTSGHPVIAKKYLLQYSVASTRSRTCPACLQDPQPYGRIDWMVRHVVACQQHQVLLINQCFQCQGSFSLSRWRLCQCPRCGADLRVSPQQPADPLLLAGQALILGRLGLMEDEHLPSRWAMSPARHLALWHVLDLIGALCHFFWFFTKPGGDDLQPRTTARESGQNAVPLEQWAGYLKVCYCLMMDWPTGYFAVLDSLRDTSALYHLLGVIANKCTREPAFGWLAQEFGTYVCHRPSWFLSPVSPSKRGLLTPMLPVTIGAGAPISTQDGLLPDEWIAYDVLGIAIEAVHVLIENRVLASCCVEVLYSRKRYWVAPDDLTAFVKRWLDRLVPDPLLAQQMNFCPLDGLGNPTLTGHLLLYIYEQRLPLFVRQPHQYLFAALAVAGYTVTDLHHRWREVFCPTRYYLSKQQAAEWLAMPETRLMVVVRRGMLRMVTPAQVDGVIKGQDAVISARDVESFALLYLFDDTVARMLGCSLDEVHTWIWGVPELIAVRMEVQKQVRYLLHQTILKAFLALLPMGARSSASDQIVADVPARARHRAEQALLFRQVAARLRAERVIHQYILKGGVTLPYMRIWRQQRGWSQRELANAAGLSLATIQDLEECNQRANGATLVKVAEALEISWEQFLYAIPDQEPVSPD